MNHAWISKSEIRLQAQALGRAGDSHPPEDTLHGAGEKFILL